MSDVQQKPTVALPGQKTAFESSGEVGQLRFEVRRLTAQLEQCETKLANAMLREEHIRASFALALAEREKILSSQAWRATRSIQRAVGAVRLILPSVRRRGAPRSELTEQTAPSLPDKIPSLAPLSYQDWAHAYGTLSPADREAITADIATLTAKPVISLLIRDSDPEPALREKTLASIHGQLYPHWEICRGGEDTIAGDFFAVLEPGHILAEQALYEIVLEFQHHPEAALVYTDDDRIDDQGRLSDPILKPDFSIDLQLACPLTNALTVYRRSMLETIGLVPQDIEPGRDAGLTLEIASRFGAAAIRHISAVLCHRPVATAEIAHLSDRAAAATGLAAVARRIAPIEITPLPDHPQWNRVTWPLPALLPRVSVIIPTRDRPDLLARCVLGLLYRTDYPDLEILILDNESVDSTTLSLFRMLQADPRVRVIPISGPFNYSALNNAGAREAAGDILVMLNNDVDVIEAHWLKEMVSHAVRPDVGAVGAKLLYADGRIQHAGVVLGVGEHNAGPGVAGHFGLGAEPDDAGYLGQFAVTREVSAVTGACVALRREVYEVVGGLNERELPVSFNDVDFCLRLRGAGFRIIWTPFATLYHLESASRGRQKTPEQIEQAALEADYMRTVWGPVLDRDPFYNPAFDRKNHAFELARPPHRRKPWRRASFDPAKDHGPN